MKNVFVVFLIISHLFATSGFSMSIHECGGVKSYSLLNMHIGETCECDHAAETMEDGCCKDKKIVINAIAKDKISSKILLVKSKVQLFSPYLTQQLSNYKSSVLFAITCIPCIEYPPQRYSPPLYIMYGVFLI